MTLSPSTPSPEKPPAKKIKLAEGVELATLNQTSAAAASKQSALPTKESLIESVLNPSEKANMEDTDLDLFPGGNAPTGNNGPQTPPRNDHLNAAAPGELSPPRSQGNPTSTTTATNGSAATNGHPAVGNTQDNTQNGTTAVSGGTNGAQQGAVAGTGYDNSLGNTNGNTWQPGEWRSKKNVEETARAWDYVVEPNWNANQFGDVMERARQQARGFK